MSKTLTLYELADHHRDIFARIEEAEGELTPELEAELDGLSSSLESKVDACCVRFQELGQTACAITAEIDRLKARLRSCESNQTRLKSYMKLCLERIDRDRVDTQRFSVRLQGSPPSAKWTGDPDHIPTDYRREKVVVDFDARTAIADFKAGIELPAGVEVKQSRHLVIR